MNLLSKISFLKRFNLSYIRENSFHDYEILYKKFSINPYNKIINENIDFCSYTYVVNGSKKLEEYEVLEEKYIKLFKFLFHTYSVSCIVVESDKLSIIQYDNFLSFKIDLIKALREDTKINFLLNELGLVVNCNFDLIIIAYFFDDSIDFSDLSDIVDSFELFFNEITE
jgi:hypothetical protein